MPTLRPTLLASAAAAVVLAAAACSSDATAPEAPAAVSAPQSSLVPLSLSASAAVDTSSTDSIAPGYGTNPCGGLEYQHFEYDPETGTEYIVCSDTTAAKKELEPTPTDPPPPPATSPAPTPAPAPAPAPAPTSGDTVPKDSIITGYPGPAPQPTEPDSVQSGYGSGSTGGLEYDRFEYEPETGTEYVATPDATPAKPESDS
jgi:hypothetical protein